MIIKGMEEQKRSEIYQAWIALLPLMQEGKIKFKPFAEYYDHCTGKDIDQRSTEEILAEVEAIRAEVGKE